jgi:hypothetical protein
MRWLEALEQEAELAVAPATAAPPVFADPSLFVINPSFAVQELLPAVDRSIVEATAKDGSGDERRRPARLRAAVLAAAFAAATGDDEGARGLALKAAADAKPITMDGALDQDTDRDPWDASHAAALAAAVELSAGDVARAGELLMRARHAYALHAIYQYRSERAPDRLGLFYPSWSIIEEGVDTALVTAAEGDGARLAAFLRKPSSEPGGYLRLGAPLVLKGQHEVLAWIRVGHRMPGWFRSPSDQAVHWAVLASTASALGDAALAAELRERAARFRKAVLERSTAVPLAVLERL